jgi:hypothetical protein
MLRLKEDANFELTNYDQDVSWDQMVSLLKNKKRFTVTATANLLRGNGFEIELRNLRLKFMPGGVVCRSSSVDFTAFRKDLTSIKAHLSSADDSTVVVTLIYTVSPRWERVIISGV